MKQLTLAAVGFERYAKTTHEDLGFDRLGQRHPAENRSGHYARQRNHVASPPAS